MSDDVIERAEAAWNEWGHLAIIPELVAELKAARAENERLRQVIASETGGLHPSGDCGGDCSGCLEGDEVDA